MHTDYIIVGQGISGSFLSYYLMQAGKSVVVIDQARPYTSSKVAAAIINPVTGKRMLETWLAGELMPFAWKEYKQLENILHTPLIRQCDILDFHPLRESRDLFERRVQEGAAFLNMAVHEQEWEKYFRFNYGIGHISPVWLVEANAFLASWRTHLANAGQLREEQYIHEECTVTELEVRYKDITAQKIFFCDGVDGFDNPWFSILPYTRNKGEVLLASIPGLPRDHIYKQGIKIVPWLDSLFWVGASFDWKYDTPEPTAAFRKKVTEQLDYWLRIPYSIEDHIVSERPTTVGQVPFAGLHPVQQNVGVLNGMGTKGCSLAPYLAYHLAQHVVNGTDMPAHADVKRFSRILSAPRS